eukprot:TRINITY_DN4572_c0_g1_i3.p1 TRINITY_DN4572_c0_g1~~TRINITY_DN4572_c0_g1_i3.p1  ORF type:complete len:403 (+),score=61.59 TRINITY_DN4572_c0_g1_i3:117-1211(+)
MKSAEEKLWKTIEMKSVPTQQPNTTPYLSALLSSEKKAPEQKPAQNKPTDKKSAEPKSGEKKYAEPKSADKKPAEPKSVEKNSAQPNSVQKKLKFVEQKSAVLASVEQKPSPSAHPIEIKSESMENPSSSNSFSSRVVDVESGSSHLNPICGLADQPLLSLAECIKRSGLPGLAINVRCATLFAKNLLLNKKHKQQECALTADEIAAIHLYTQESSFYTRLNAMLRDSNRSVLRPLFPYLKLLMTGIRKLPFFEGLLFRGVRKNLVGQYLVGADVVWWSLGSTSASLSVLTSNLFCGASGDRTVFQIQAKYAVDISEFSAVPGEFERILLPGTTLEVQSTALLGDLQMVHLQETDIPMIFAEFE